MVTKFVLVPNPGERVGVFHFYEFVASKNQGGIAGFVNIYEPRFYFKVCYYLIS